MMIYLALRATTKTCKNTSLSCIILGFWSQTLAMIEILLNHFPQNTLLVWNAVVLGDSTSSQKT